MNDCESQLSITGYLAKQSNNPGGNVGRGVVSLFGRAAGDEELAFVIINIYPAFLRV